MSRGSKKSTNTNSSIIFEYVDESKLVAREDARDYPVRYTTRGEDDRWFIEQMKSEYRAVKRLQCFSLKTMGFAQLVRVG